MKKKYKELFEEFLKSKFTFYRDVNDKLIRFDYTEIVNWRLRFILFWYESVLSYKVYEMEKDLLGKVLTKKNTGVTNALKKLFQDRDLKIIKLHKFNNKQLIKYQLFIIGKDDNKWCGLKANIL